MLSIFITHASIWGEKKPKVELEKREIRKAKVSLFLSSALSLKVSSWCATTLLSYDFSRLSSLTSTTQPHKVDTFVFWLPKTRVLLAHFG